MASPAAKPHPLPPQGKGYTIASWCF